MPRFCILDHDCEFLVSSANVDEATEKVLETDPCRRIASDVLFQSLAKIVNPVLFHMEIKVYENSEDGMLGSASVDDA